MPTIGVQYHHEDDSWWADSSDVPGYVAVGDSIAQVRSMVREGLPFFLDVEPTALQITEAMEGGAVLVDLRFSQPRPSSGAYVAPVKRRVRSFLSVGTASTKKASTGTTYNVTPAHA